MRVAILSFLVIITLDLTVQAQWTMTTPGLLGTISQNTGGMTFKDGVAWAGTYELWKSVDSGRTWTKSPLTISGDIANIYFLDRLTGLVATHSGYTYKTIDGGATWNTIIYTGTATSAVFVDDANHILVSQFSPGIVHYSGDGGKTWGSVSNNNWVREIVPATNGRAYLLSGDWGDRSHLWTTTDYGHSWSKQPGVADCDSYSFDVEACDSRHAYIIDEEYSVTAGYDGESEIFVSSDEGITWNVTFTHSAKYLAGSIAMSSHAQFCQTVAEVKGGIVRSTDHGTTWVNIGGPSASGDTRLLSAIDDNNLIGSGPDGSIWITTNSGGKPLNISQTTASSLLFASTDPLLQMTQCGDLDTFIRIGVAGCTSSKFTLDSISLSGYPWFQLRDMRPMPRTISDFDSIGVQYLPTGNVRDTARMTFHYHIGTTAHDTTIIMMGQAASPLLLAPVYQHAEVQHAVYGETVALSLTVDVAQSIDLDSLWPSIKAMRFSVTFDSAQLAYGGYTPPTGWILTSLAVHGNRLDVEISNSISTSTRPLDLGSISLRAKARDAAFSLLHLDSIAINVSGKQSRLCIARAEDRVWEVEIEQMGRVASLEELDGRLQVYPNPTSDYLNVRDGRGEVIAVSVYDALGRTVASERSVDGCCVIDVERLASGSYVVLCRLSEGVVTRRINVVRR